MRAIAAVAAMATVVLLAGCQRAPDLPAAEARATALDYEGEARGALARQDYALAAAHLRAVLAGDPASVFAHYSLGVCASYLGRLDEATGEFQWIVQHAPRASEERRLARQWLAQREGDGRAGSTPELVAGAATVRGVALWPPADGQAPAPRARQQLHLIGLRGTPTQGLTHVLRTDKNGRYTFTNVAPGAYRLVDVIAGTPKWRLKVVLAPGQDVTLDLTPDNNARLRDDFPDATRG